MAEIRQAVLSVGLHTTIMTTDEAQPSPSEHVYQSMCQQPSNGVFVAVPKNGNGHLIN